MTRAEAVPARARRHPMPVVNRSRELVAAGWTLVETAHLLHEELGVVVDERSIGRWTNPELADRISDRQELRNARRAAENGRRGMSSGRERPEFKLARMQRLREMRFSLAEIADLMAFDFGDRMWPSTVARALEAGKYPRGLG